MIVYPTVVSELPEPETLPHTAIEVIGSVDGRQYARTKDGRELLVGGMLEPWERENPPKPAELRIERRAKVQTREMAFPEMRTIITRATVVPSGSFEQATEREKQKQEAAARRSNPPYLPVDALAATPALARQQERIIPLAAPANPLLDGSALHLGGSPAIRGPRAILDYLTSKGIRLQPTRDGLGVLVRAKSGRLDPQVREAVRATARLLAGELTGSPVSCELCSGKDRQPAVTIAEVDIAICEQHATEAQP